MEKEKKEVNEQYHKDAIMVRNEFEKLIKGTIFEDSYWVISLIMHPKYLNDPTIPMITPFSDDLNSEKIMYALIKTLSTMSDVVLAEKASENRENVKKLNDLFEEFKSKLARDEFKR